MKRCLWYRRNNRRKEVAVNDFNLKRDSEMNGMKDEVWFDSKLVFDSDSDDDFMSVNGDSLPSSFGYAYTSQGTPRPSFTSLKERMEELMQEKAAREAFFQPESGQKVPEERTTLGQLFATRLEQDRDLESENKQSEMPMTQQGLKKWHPNNEVSQRSCFSGLFPSIGLEKKVSSNPVAQKTSNTQSWLPYRICAS